MRPHSIVLFEKVFFASLAVQLVSTVLSWSQVDAMIDDPAVRAAGIGGGAVAFSMLLGFLLPLLLWYFIARRASNVAKWIFVVLVALSLLPLLSALLNPLVPKGILTIVAVIGTALQVYAAWLLFKPDAKAWLEGGARPNSDGPDRLG